MKDIIPAKKQSPILGLSGMGGGVGSNIVAGLAKDTPYIDELFSTYVYEGNNGAQSGLGPGVDLTKGGLAWVKRRNNAESHYLFDSERVIGGVYQSLATNTANTQDPRAWNIAFNNNGLAFNDNDGGINASGSTYVNWQFRKRKGFFDIVTWNGDSTAGRQISHELGTIPGCIMVKRTNSVENWVVYHRSIGNNRGSSGQDSSYTSLQLNSTNGQDTSIEYWNNTLPTKDNFTLGIHPTVNQTGGEYVAYIFAHGDTGAGQYTTGLPTSHVKSPNGVYTAAANPPTMSTGPFGVSNTALTFSGTTPHPYTVIASPGMNPGSQNYTYECWFKGDSATWSRGWSMLMSRWQDNGIYIGLKANGYAGVYDTFNADNANFNLGWTQDTWHHLAVVRDGGVTRMYLDGTQKGSFTNSQNYDNKYSNLDIGSASTSSGGSQEEFSGQMSNVRVVIGQAIYPGSSNTLTVPTSNLTLTSQGADPKKVVFLGLNGSANPDYEEAHKFGEDEEDYIIKCGSYDGASEISVICGFEPQLLLIKAYTSSANSNCDWLMIDSMRGLTAKGANEAVLRSNMNNSEGSYDNIHMSVASRTDRNNGPLGFTGTGGYDNSSNAGNGPYLYIAIRRPDGYVAKPAEAGTDVFTTDVGTSGSGNPGFDSGFPVDFAFIKQPAGSGLWNTSARLIQGKYLQTNGSDAEGNDASGTLFDYNNGYYGSGGISDWNAWMWKRHAGFDCITHTGNGVAGRQISHSLNAVPEMIWSKPRSNADHWKVYHKGLNNGTTPEQWFINLNGTSIESQGGAQIWNNTAPTSTHFTVGTDNGTNASGWTYLVLLFSSVDGISKVGYYTGNGSTLAISLGFQPRFLIVRSSSGSGNWNVLDTLRGWTSGADQVLELQATGAQQSFDVAEPTSTGFTLTSTQNNVSGEKYIYYAHA